MEGLQSAVDITHVPEITFDGPVGKIITIKVVGNITTGYNWFISQDNYNEENVKCLNKSEFNSGEYVSTTSPEQKICGAPGFLLFKFQLNSPGDHKILLEYKRAWETGVAANKSKVLNFKCQA